MSVQELIEKYVCECAETPHEEVALRNILSQFANDLTRVVENNFVSSPANTIDTDRCWDDGNF